jgi:transposase
LKLNPTTEQKQLLEEMAGCYRYTFNKTIALYTAKNSFYKNEYKIRDRIVTTKNNNFFNNKPWLNKCPKSMRQDAVKTAIANMKACFANLRNGNIKHFTAPFKRKKTEMLNGWSIGMDKAAVQKNNNNLHIYKTILGEMKYYNTKQLHKLLPGKNPTMDPKIQKDRFGDYYLILTRNVEKKARKEQDVKLILNVGDDGKISAQITTYTSAALDPGVRKTLVSYSPEREESFMIGKGQATTLVSQMIIYDKLLSHADKNHKLTKQAKHQMIKIRKRIFNLKKEFRDQTASFLAQRYNTLLVPKLETQNMAQKANRRLTTKTVRSMLILGHYELFKTIERKCQEYGTIFLHVKEHYTSQTCPHCGTTQKCNETYKCKTCGFICDRDILGAANNYLKAVRTTDPREVA